MPGMEFEYDEKGGTFYYFLLSFMAFILVPLTFYLWPRSEKKSEEDRNREICQCKPCELKGYRLKHVKPWAKFKRRLTYFILTIGWLAFIAVAYKASQVEIDYSEFDPYAELGIDRGATVSEIKKAYRRLSLVHHPDKDGDPVKFMRITKAHLALTDDEARKNWEEYGNPDGPGATHFGIALPKWIVEKQNSVWVLAVYGLVFMIILPVVVGTWWYRSIKYSAEQILMDTTQLYYFSFNKTPSMNLKRVIMILAASFEFEKGHNNEIVERPSDNEEMPALMRELSQLNEKNKEKPYCYPYSVKARALLHALFSRADLPPQTLEQDQHYIMKKCPYLLNEMVNIVAHLVALAHCGKVARTPKLNTIENIMKLSPMIVQACWYNSHHLLQLPHFDESLLKHFTTKKRVIRSVKNLVGLKEVERRNLLRNLSDEQYTDVMTVCKSLPYVTLEIKSKVLDDEDPTITAGSIVTVSVTLKRQNMEVLLDSSEDAASQYAIEDLGLKDGAEENDCDTPKKSTKVWEKNKKKGKSSKNKKKQAPKPTAKKKAIAANSTTVATTQPEAECENTSGVTNGPVKKSGGDDMGGDSSGEESNAGDSDADTQDDGAQVDDDEAAWNRFQMDIKKDSILETKSKKTHLVHCPYFPQEKQEWWWLYIADKKYQQIITAPVQVCSLKDEEKVDLKFSAPRKPGTYQYALMLRSDSYLGLDQEKSIKLDVKEEKKIENHPQWDDVTDDDDDDKGDDNDVSDTDDSYDLEDDEE